MAMGTAAGSEKHPLRVQRSATSLHPVVPLGPAAPSSRSRFTRARSHGSWQRWGARAALEETVPFALGKHHATSHISEHQFQYSVFKNKF